MRVVRVVWLAACLTALAAGWGEPIEAVLKGVAAPEVNTRIQALQRAIDEELRDPRLSEPLRTLAADANPRVRALAITLLGRYADDTGVGDILFRALDDKDIGVQRAAIAAQERLGDHRAEERLVALANAKDSPLRPDALAALVRKWGHRNLQHAIQDSPRMPEMIAAALRDPDAVLRWKTAKALADVAQRDRIPDQLLNLLKPSVADASIRLAVLQALVYSTDLGAPAVLVGAVHDKDEAVRAQAWQSLREYRDRLPGPTFPPAYLRAVSPLLADRDAAVRQAAADLLLAVNFDDPAVAPLLRPLLADRDAGVRAYTAMALGQLKDAASLEPLIAALGDKDAGVRAEAAGALGALADRRALHALLPMVTDAEKYVRMNVAHALGCIGDPAAVEALLLLYTDENDDVSEFALRGLGKFPDDPRVVKALATMLTRGRPKTRVATVEALSDANSPTSIDALVAALQDRDPLVRAPAARALIHAKDNPRVTEALLNLLNDPDGEVVENAAFALAALRDPRAAREVLLLFDRFAPRRAGEELPRVFYGVEIAMNHSGEVMRRTLLAGLTDPDAAMRDAALRALIWYPDARAVPLVIPLLRDPRPETRRQVATILGQTRDARGVEPLITALDDADPAVRNEALWALSRISDLRALTALVARVDLVMGAEWRGGPDEWEGDGLGSDPLGNFLGQLTLIDDPGMTALLARLLDANALTSTTEPPVDKEMADACELDDGQQQKTRVRAAAVSALARRGDAAAVDALTDRLRAAAGRKGPGYPLDRDAAPAVVERMLALTRDAAAEVRLYALDAVNALRHDPRVREAFARAARDPDPEVRELVRLLEEDAALEALDTPEDLLSSLCDRSPDERPMMFRNIGERLLGPHWQSCIVGSMGERRSLQLPPLSAPVVDPAPFVGPLLARLTDTDTGIRIFAIDLLTQIGTPRALDRIYALLKDDDHEVASTALIALARRGDARVFDPAVAWLAQADEVYEGGEYGYVSAAARALGLLKDPRAVEPLLAALKRMPRHPDILWALAVTGGVRAVEPLLSILQEDSPDVGETLAMLNAFGPKEVQQAPLAVMLLGELRDPRAVEPLLRLLDRLRLVGSVAHSLAGSRRPTVDTRRDLVIAALGRIGDRRAVEPLIAALSQGVMAERRAAAVALEQLGDPRAIEPLRAELPNLTGSARAAAQHALAVLSGKGS